MSAYVLFGCVGYLLGSLLINTPGHILWPGVLLALAISLAGWMITRGIWAFKSIALILGIFIGYVAVQNVVKHEAQLVQEVSFDGEALVVDKEETKSWYQPIRLRPFQDEFQADILFRAPRSLEVTPGERIRLQCELQRPKNFDERFDYTRYLMMQGIGYICEHGHGEQGQIVDSAWRHFLFATQSVVRKEIGEFLPDPAAGLLQGLFLGGDDSLPKSISESFRRAGLSHVVAVSGYNMTLVASVFLVAALAIGLWRRAAVILALVGVGCFMALIDTSAASIRAAIMTFIIMFAYLIGRPHQMLSSLIIAGSFMALMNPLIVRYDIGFQLSFMATAALATILPWAELLLKKTHRAWRLLSLPGTTLVISLFIDPIVAFHFGTVSIVSPIANTLVLPLIPLAMIFGFALVIVGWCLPLLVPIILFPTWLVLMSIVWIASLAGSLSLASLENLYVREPILWIWALVLLGGVWYSRKSFYAYVFRMDRSDHIR